MTSRPSASHHHASPSVAAVSVVLWCLGTAILAITPVYYYAASGSDGATPSELFRLAATMMLTAWPFLAAAIALAARGRGEDWRKARTLVGSVILLAVAGGLFAVAKAIADTDSLSDVAWVVYWTACAGVWVGLSWLVLRPLGG